ncbi:MAG: 3-deoxy-8-phosphooctulonate synthase [candidate division NC10 bacterium]|nr:3-deoxy-8-phosphooctulonate synthase [candidate division NC10 bacterium]MBI2163894.1 3-deoxy-8-phosphooctulonate synthase [candidate division NC10 bacterium]MBI2561168.1 3-deoxy-8-phosphooctulonate synthase [candidate division NC10 bacterium]MBI3121363.1 3-deoxy-8-phosphooctulonate synthase [candidate division NC10 bacterium]
MVTREVVVGSVRIGGGNPLALIAGPCVIEEESHLLRVGERLLDICGAAGVPLILKASFDKANRTSHRSYRGPGLAEGLRILARVRAKLGIPILSDVHESGQVGAAAEVLDILQIPAFLCRQTDLLLAAGRTGKPVNVKKGQVLAPGDMRNVVEKIRSTGNTQILLTERGSSFGYNNLVVDLRGLPIMRGLGVPVIFDGTHSVQLPGGAGTASSGQREFVAPLVRAAVAAGCDGLFLEVHPDPDRAPSDGSTMLPLDALPPLLAEVTAIARALARPV